MTPWITKPVPFNIGQGAAAGAAAFSPSDISDLFAWYDANDSSTITESSGRVSQWDNKEGTTARDLVQATSDNQPLVDSGDRNGLDVIDFADERYMKSAFTEIDQPITIAAAAQIPTSGNQSLWDGSDNGYNRGNTGASSGAPNGEFAIFADSGGIQTPTITNLYGSWAYVIGIYNSTSSQIRLNGSEEVEGNVGTGGQEGFTIGAQNNDSGFSNTKIGEIIAYNKVVSGDELENLETYLAEKWDI